MAMRGQTSRGKIIAVDDGPRNIHTLDTRADGLHMSENILREHMRRDRSAAYWFAASTWGIAGLVIGACLGAYMMYVASVSTLPVAQEAVARGMQLNDFRSRMEQQAEPASPNSPAQP